jgi:hypothetical protein
MARRKGVRKKGGNKRKYRVYARKVGAVNISSVAMTIGGMVASRFIVNSLSKTIPMIGKSAQSKAISQIALGFLTRPVMSAIGNKSASLDALATGMVVGGGFELVKSVLPSQLAGMDEGDVIVVSGNEISEINGMDDIGMDISEINGMDDIGEIDYEY